MLTVRQPDTLAVDWVAEFDQQANRPSEAARFSPALTISGNRSDQSSLQRASGNGQVVLFDGVLYNRAELECALDIDGTAGDAALLLHAFAKWGEDFLQHLKGLFVVAAWDSATARLIAARDP